MASMQTGEFSVIVTDMISFSDGEDGKNLNIKSERFFFFFFKFPNLGNVFVGICAYLIPRNLINLYKKCWNT